MTRVLFCGGSPYAGSWQMRAEQIAACRPDWLAVNTPTLEQIEAAEAIVVVKRAKPGLANLLRGSGKALVWDALDFWQQPEDGLKVQNTADAQALVVSWCEMLRPRAIIAATQAMAEDLRGFAEQVVCIYHHARLNTIIRPPGNVLHYDGMARYLGGWGALAELATMRIGWRFDIAPPDVDAGALLAVRDGAHGSWLARRWKSNVKAVNAIALGLPFIAWPDAAYLETVPEGLGLWFTNETEFYEQVQMLKRAEIFSRASAAAEKVREDFSLPAIVNRYENLLASL